MTQARASTANESASALSGRTSIVAWTLLIVLYVLLRWRFLDVPLDRDEGVFGWIGQSILRGDVPYRDVFDHKPPGVFYVYALALKLVPASAAGVHTFLAIWNGLTLLVVASTARAYGDRETGLWAGLVYALVSTAAGLQGYAATTEMLLLLPLAGAVRLTVAAMRTESTDARRRRRMLLVAAGAVAAFAFWIKQSAAIALVCLPIALLLDSDRRRALLDVTWLTLGTLITTAIVIVPFAAAGLWEPFWYWSFTHSLIYSEWSWNQVPGEQWRADVIGGLRALRADVFVPLGAATIAGIVSWRSRTRTAWLPLLFVLTSLTSTLQSAFVYEHYFAQIVPSVALAGGLGLAFVRKRLGADRTGSAQVRRCLALALLVLAVPLIADRRYWFTAAPEALIREHAGDQGFEAAPLLAEHLASRSGVDDWIYVHGSEPQLAFLSDRRLSNPFGMAYPFTGPYPRQQEFQERVWDTIDRTRPLFIVTTRSPYSLMMGPDTSRDLEQRVGALIDTAYRIEAQLIVEKGTWRIARDVPEAVLHGLRNRAFTTIWVRR